MTSLLCAVPDRHRESLTSNRSTQKKKRNQKETPQLRWPKGYLRTSPPWSRSSDQANLRPVTRHWPVQLGNSTAGRGLVSCNKPVWIGTSNTFKKSCKTAFKVLNLKTFINRTALFLKSSLAVVIKSSLTSKFGEILSSIAGGESLILWIQARIGD